MEQWIVWLVIIILLTMIEVTSLNLTTIWFVASGIVSLIISLFYDNYTVQFGIFVILGVILLITTKPVLVKHLKKKDVKTNADRIIGMHGIVTEKIEKTTPGEVKVDGKRWTAYGDNAIAKDKTVEILEINGVKLKVKEVKEEE